MTQGPAPSISDAYTAMHQSFRWAVPNHFNMAEVCSRRWGAQADASERVAVITHSVDGHTHTHSYAELCVAADALSHVLASQGVQRGDRVAIVLPQRFETAVAYMAVLQLGAVAMPL